MILLYLDDKNSIPLVLDNLSSKVVKLTKRKKLIPKFAFNEINAYRLTHKGFTKKINLKWQDNNLVSIASNLNQLKQVRKSNFAV
jgi:hypothetical protein